MALLCACQVSLPKAEGGMINMRGALMSIPSGLQRGREKAVDTGFHPSAGIERMLDNEWHLWRKCPSLVMSRELMLPATSSRTRGSELCLAGDRECGQGIKGSDSLCSLPCARQGRLSYM